MAITSISQLKKWFADGEYPTGERFAALLDSFYHKSEAYTKDELNAKLSAIPKFGYKVVSSLPTEGISGTTVYILPGTADPSVYTEHIYEDGAWYEIGRQNMNLDDYAKKSDVPTVVQTPGDGDDKVMSQRSVTNLLNIHSTSELENGIVEFRGSKVLGVNTGVKAHHIELEVKKDEHYAIKTDCTPNLYGTTTYLAVYVTDNAQNILIRRGELHNNSDKSAFNVDIPADGKLYVNTFSGIEIKKIGSKIHTSALTDTRTLAQMCVRYNSLPVTSSRNLISTDCLYKNVFYNTVSFDEREAAGYVLSNLIDCAKVKEYAINKALGEYCKIICFSKDFNIISIIKVGVQIANGTKNELGDDVAYFGVNCDINNFSTLNVFAGSAVEADYVPRFGRDALDSLLPISEADIESLKKAGGTYYGSSDLTRGAYLYTTDGRVNETVNTGKAARGIRAAVKSGDTVLLKSTYTGYIYGTTPSKAVYLSDSAGNITRSLVSTAGQYLLLDAEQDGFVYANVNDADAARFALGIYGSGNSIMTEAFARLTKQRVEALSMTSVTAGRNLVNSKSLRNGIYISPSTFAETPKADYACTNLIDCSGGKVFAVNHAIGQYFAVIYYDRYGNAFASCVEGSEVEGGYGFTAPDDASYFCITGEQKYMPTLNVFAGGTVEKEYVPRFGGDGQEANDVDNSLEIVFPDILPVVVGRQMNIYYENLLKGAWLKEVDVSIDSLGDAYGEGRMVYGNTVNSNSGKIVVKSMGKVLRTKSFTKDVVPADSGNGKTAKIMVIGDSKTQDVTKITEVQRLLAQDSITANFVGTRGEGNLMHEARGGWGMINYYQSKSYNTFSNPFCNESKTGTMKFDFQYYHEQHPEVQLPQIVWFDLGINEYQWWLDHVGDNLMVNRYEEMMSDIKAVIPDAIFVVSLQEGQCLAPVSPKSPGKGHAKKMLDTAVPKLMSHFQNRESEHIYICPQYLGLDLYNDFKMEETAISNRNERTELQCIDITHPAPAGYYKNADWYYTVIKRILRDNL